MKILHISDLHFGHHDPVLAEGFADDINAQAPDLIVASGDFTQIGTSEEFQQAREFLDKLKAPVFSVPGNHDVPAVNILRRFINPYGLYRKYISPVLEPFLEMDGVVLVGMRTSRRARLEWNWGHGTISRGQLEDLKARFDKASANAVRIIVAHHPLLFPTAPMVQKTKRVKRADDALECFASLGVRLVLSGHFHLSYVRKHESKEAAREGEPTGLSKSTSSSILVAQASSAISTRLRGEANAYNLIEVGDAITVTVREWRDGQWRTRDKASEPV